MKQELSPEHREALTRYRLERAHKTLEEAIYLRNGGYFNAAVNRLYYACFYAASGLLIANGIEASTHAGVKAMLSYHFVRTGKLEVEHGVTFSNLFDKRHSGDYEDFAYCDKSLVDYLYPRAKAFVETVETLTTGM